jgi:hypothetical protein
MTETTASTRTAELILEMVEQWSNKLNRRMEFKFGGEVSDDVYFYADVLRLSLRDLLHKLEEEDERENTT